MDKSKLKEAVVKTLGFDPEEIKYKLEVHDTEIAEIRELLKVFLPRVGQLYLVNHFLLEYLKEQDLDPRDYIDENVTKEVEKIQNSLGDEFSLGDEDAFISKPSKGGIQ